MAPTRAERFHSMPARPLRATATGLNSAATTRQRELSIRAGSVQPRAVENRAHPAVVQDALIVLRCGPNAISDIGAWFSLLVLDRKGPGFAGYRQDSKAMLLEHPSGRLDRPDADVAASE